LYFVFWLRFGIGVGVGVGFGFLTLQPLALADMRPAPRCY
jgi:hypothetical protein